MEYLDLVDENNRLTGEKKTRNYVHQKGLWHREIEVWVCNDVKEILVQKRSSNKKLMPNKWTSACAGHIDAGESIIDSALRELNEELGITDLLAADLKFITTLKSSRVTDKIINNHFKYIYFHKTNKKLEELVLQKEEVEEVKYLSIKEVENIIKNKNEDYLFSNRENINQIIDYIKEKN